MNGLAVQNPTDGPQTLADWQQYRQNALAALNENPHDPEAEQEARRAMLKINALQSAATERPGGPAVNEIAGGTLDGFSVGQWRTILHKSLTAYRANPRDREAAQWAQRALLKINALNVGGNETDANAVHQTSPVASTAAGLLHGLSLGTGEVMSGVNTALQGKGFRQGAQDYRENLGDLESSHPYLTTTPVLGAENLAAFALPAAQVGRTAAQTVKAGVPLTIRQALSLVGRGAAAGAVPGAVAGFSQGGEDPGDFGARLERGAEGGAAGALVGAGTAGIAARFARRHVERAADLMSRGVARETRSVNLDNARIRNELLKRRFAQNRNLPERTISNGPVDDIGQAIEDYKAGRISEDDLNTALSFATREPNAHVSAEIPTQGPKEGAPARAASTVSHRTPDELDVATFKRRNTPIPGAEGGPIARQLGMRRDARPGHAIYSGEPGPSRSAEVRGGEPLLPSAQPEATPSVNTGAADAYLRAGNLSQLERFDPGELASRANALRGIGPVQMARVVSYLSGKLSPEIPGQALVP